MQKLQYDIVVKIKWFVLLRLVYILVKTFFIASFFIGSNNVAIVVVVIIDFLNTYYINKEQSKLFSAYVTIKTEVYFMLYTLLPNMDNFSIIHGSEHYQQEKYTRKIFIFC